MSKIKFTAEKNKGLSFTYTEGTFTVVIQAFEWVEPSGQGKKPYYKVTFRGDFGTDTKTYGFRMFDTAFGRSDLYDLAEAVGLDPKGEMDTEDFIDRYVNITLEEGELYNDKPQWEVVAIEPAGDVEDDEDDYADDDVEDDEDDYADDDVEDDEWDD